MQPRFPIPTLHVQVAGPMLALLAACGGRASSTAFEPAPAPATLAATGLYAPPMACGSPGHEMALAPGVRTYTPQYPLWTDGAGKRRWIALPDGGAIDASNPCAWVFPVGTKLWKEFSFGGRIETRYMERLQDGAWRYATYSWLEGASDATLAPEEGLRGVCETGLGTRHDVPSMLDCRACHEAHPSRVLGFGALQLASLRDPLAPHAELPGDGDLDLTELLARGLVRGDRHAIEGLGAAHAARPPRERAALGYLHANCAGCHNASGPLATLGLSLEVTGHADSDARVTALDVISRYVPPGATHAVRVAPGRPEASVLLFRMASRSAASQMPPLGTHAVDESALALVREWIGSDLVPHVPITLPLPRRP